MGLHSAAVRRLTGDEHLGRAFATEWSEYDLPDDTRALLRYASKLTETPSFVGEEDTLALKEAGWDDRAIWEITALASFFNFSGRLEAASGLPPDEIPESKRFQEASGMGSPGR